MTFEHPSHRRASCDEINARLDLAHMQIENLLAEVDKLDCNLQFAERRRVQMEERLSALERKAGGVEASTASTTPRASEVAGAPPALIHVTRTTEELDADAVSVPSTGMYAQVVARIEALERARVDVRERLMEMNQEQDEMEKRIDALERKAGEGESTGSGTGPMSPVGTAAKTEGTPSSCPSPSPAPSASEIPAWIPSALEIGWAARSSPDGYIAVRRLIADRYNAVHGGM